MNIPTSRSTLMVAAAIFAAAIVAAVAIGPAWWTERGVLDPQAPDDDFQVANAGQLKHTATAAYHELQAAIGQFGGAGSDVAAMVNSFSPDGNYEAINQGQLKHVAAPFYERLNAIGYCSGTPWADGTPDDWSIINVGQLKNVFSFDLALDSDADEMPDWWEANYGLDPYDAAGANGAAGDPDGDGVDNLTEFLQGRSPGAGVDPGAAGTVELIVFNP